MSEESSRLLEIIAAHQRRENARYERELDRRIAEADRFVQSITSALLALDPGLRKIVLFGSLAAGRVRRMEFDIDLGVESDRYLKIVDWSLQQSFRIDVVDLQEVDAGFAEEIARHGRVLYEAKRR